MRVVYKTHGRNFNAGPPVFNYSESPLTAFGPQRRGDPRKRVKKLYYHIVLYCRGKTVVNHTCACAAVRLLQFGCPRGTLAPHALINCDRSPAARCVRVYTPCIGVHYYHKSIPINTCVRVCAVRVCVLCELECTLYYIIRTHTNITSRVPGTLPYVCVELER